MSCFILICPSIFCPVTSAMSQCLTVLTLHEHIGQMTSLDLLHSKQLTLLPIAILPNETNETPMVQLIIEPLNSAIKDEKNSAQMIIDNNNEFEESIFTFLSYKRKK